MAKTLWWFRHRSNRINFVVILYANAFVMKTPCQRIRFIRDSRSDRKNIQLLSLIELVVFAALSIGLGVNPWCDFPCGIICDSIETHSIRYRY